MTPLTLVNLAQAQGGRRPEFLERTVLCRCGRLTGMGKVQGVKI